MCTHTVDDPTDVCVALCVLIRQMETVHNELSAVRVCAAEAEQKLTDADENLRQKHQLV